jgi:hypothetical protein
MVCQVEGCFAPAVEVKTLITMEKLNRSTLVPMKLKVGTAWCEQHRSLLSLFRNLEEYLRSDPRTIEMW